ncbi:MAG: type III secretion system chaperone [Succinivibrio sp.]|nr:type III secretion system chaperone [Succinivibrio sp.]
MNLIETLRDFAANSGLPLELEDDAKQVALDIDPYHVVFSVLDEEQQVVCFSDIGSAEGLSESAYRSLLTRCNLGLESDGAAVCVHEPDQSLMLYRIFANEFESADEFEQILASFIGQIMSFKQLIEDLSSAEESEEKV